MKKFRKQDKLEMHTKTRKLGKTKNTILKMCAVTTFEVSMKKKYIYKDITCFYARVKW